jgi:hypothetical protein
LSMRETHPRLRVSRGANDMAVYREWIVLATRDVSGISDPNLLDRTSKLFLIRQGLGVRLI